MKNILLLAAAVLLLAIISFPAQAITIDFVDTPGGTLSSLGADASLGGSDLPISLGGDASLGGSDLPISLGGDASLGGSDLPISLVFGSPPGLSSVSDLAVNYNVIATVPEPASLNYNVIATVPEPASLILLGSGLAGLGLLGRKRLTRRSTTGPES
jgi:PEP-CTERM motif